jgi:hypothetical protein
MALEVELLVVVTLLQTLILVHILDGSNSDIYQGIDCIVLSTFCSGCVWMSV